MGVPEIDAKTIVSAWSDCGWFGSNYTMNLYRGCSHGCIYCDSRSECYQIDDFDTVRVKADAARIVERDLKSKRKKGIVITGSMSDPYNPLEARLRLTRRALALIHRYGFGVAIDTKSSLVTRDIDRISAISEATAACVSITITTFDDAASRAIEQNICPPSVRFRALEALARAGIDCGVLLMPILPFINDDPENVRRIARAAADAGAKWVYPGGDFGLTMRSGQREHFLAHLPPALRRRYVDAYGGDYHCPSPRSVELWTALREVADQRALMCDMKSIAAHMRGTFDARAGEQITMPI
ncbi:MAG: radical SAM protein [Christensenellales bacterium]|jgi:DNA repair photolyase